MKEVSSNLGALKVVRLENYLSINRDPYDANYHFSLTGSGMYTGVWNQISDDRIKENEQFISNATVTVMKLRPQIYDKKPSMDNSNVDTWIKESGLIAQEVYYDAPELRHLVKIHSTASNIDNQISSSDDPTIDPDYSNWGDEPAGLNYTGFIPYLIKCCQEQQELIESQQSTINTQQSTITTLQTQYDDLLARVTALENP